NLLWSKTIPSDVNEIPYSIACADEDKLVLCGETKMTDTAEICSLQHMAGEAKACENQTDYLDKQAYVLRLDSAGNTGWKNLIGEATRNGPNEEAGKNIAALSGGGFLLTGF